MLIHNFKWNLWTMKQNWAWEHLTFLICMMSIWHFLCVSLNPGLFKWNFEDFVKTFHLIEIIGIRGVSRGINYFKEDGDQWSSTMKPQNSGISTTITIKITLPWSPFQTRNSPVRPSKGKLCSGKRWEMLQREGYSDNQAISVQGGIFQLWWWNLYPNIQEMWPSFKLQGQIRWS